MNFHNIVIYEDKRNFIKREIVAHPDRDGYGLETFTLTNTCGTFVVVPSSEQHMIENVTSIAVSPSSSEIKMTKTEDDDNQITITILSKSDESSASSVLRLTTSDCDIDEEFFTGKNTNHTLRQVLRCDKNIAGLVHQQSKTILILPFKFASLLPKIDHDENTRANQTFSALPCAVVSVPFPIRIIHDCTPRFLKNHSPVFPGDQIPEIVSDDFCCPFLAAKTKTNKENTACVNENRENTTDFEETHDDKNSKIEVTAFRMTEASGCHMDAAKHFNNSNKGIHEYSANDLLLRPLAIIDISSKKVFCATTSSGDEKRENPDTGVSLQDILDWEEEHKRKIPDGAFVCMKSGWSKYFYEDPKKYIFGKSNEEEQKEQHFPGFELDAAEFLMTQRNICGLGVDTLSVDKGCNTEFPVHQLVLGKSGSDKFHVENLNFEMFDCRQQQTNNNLCIMIAPMRVKDGFEAPCRALIVEKQV